MIRNDRAKFGENKDIAPNTRSWLQFSVTLRISLLIASMGILALAAGVSSYYLTGIANNNIQNLRLASDIAEKQTGVQLGWLNVVGDLDTVSVTSPTEQDREALTVHLNDLNQALDRLSGAGDVGATPEKMLENQQILLDLRAAYREIDGLAREVYDLAAENRWGTALQRRQSGLSQLQPRLVDDLARLNTNLQAYISLLSQQIGRDQALARGLALVSAALALILALNIFWVVRRMVARPLHTLETQVEQLAQGDFSRTHALERTDEIGSLSRAVVQLSSNLRASYEEMERRIKDRTEALERRTVQIQAAAQTARDIASARNLNQLLENAVELIRDRFGFYHAGIFLTDARGEYETLRAATGEAGRTMLARSHSLRIGETGERGEPVGLVGTAAYRGEAQVSSEVSQTVAHFKNPLLPDTRSEAALPLKAGGRVIGVLDVQSRLPQAFDPESLSILQVMADQLAIAIQNASLLSEVQRNLADVQRAYGEREREAWTRFFQASSEVGYVYDGLDIRPIGPHPDTGEEAEKIHEGEARPLSLPLQVRGEDVGALEIWPREGELSSEEIYLLSALNSRLGQILESARLYEETQSRAVREELINRLTTNIARAMDLDSVLKTAAVELGNIPAVSEATVRLVSPDSVMDRPASEKGRVGPNGSGEENGGGNGHRA